MISLTLNTTTMQGTNPSTEPNAPEDSAAPSRSFARRTLLTGGAAGLGAVVGAAATAAAFVTRADPLAGLTAAAAEAERVRSAGAAEAGFGGETLSCHGTHQAGITSVPAAHVRYLACDLLPETDAAALARMFVILTGDIEGLTSGTAPLADPEPELAARPARLSITVGVGPELVARVDPASVPPWLGPLPAFTQDRLEERFTGGDLLLILAADDPLPLAHAARMLQRDLKSFVTVRWQQRGFRQARGAEHDATTMRNLMGQVDGTVNPAPSDDDFASLVWLDSQAGWLSGGSAFVLRRIRLELDTWDEVDRPGREHTIGRRLSDGAPLTGGDEHTPVDFEATDALGFSVIARDAHVRRAHSTRAEERIFRRSHSYEDDTESGLLFGCYQRNPLAQFVPIQQRLDDADLLNLWVTHTGSGVYAILPGFHQGELLGSSLLQMAA